MNLLLVGISHRTAPVELRERVDFHTRGLENALRALRARDEASEAVIVSTCNRAEIYTACEEVSAARRRLLELYGSRDAMSDTEAGAIGEAAGAQARKVTDIPTAPQLPPQSEARDLLERSRRLLDSMHAEDREEAIGLHESIEEALDLGDSIALAEASRALKELLFFVEGQRVN